MNHSKNVFSSIEAFLKYTSGRKLWIFSATLFLALGSWVINYYVQIPARLPEISKNYTEIKRYKEDPENLLDLVYAMKDAAEARVAVEDYLSSVIVLIQNEQDLPQDVWTNGLNQIKFARTKYAIAVGKLQGTQFHDDRFF